MSLKPAGKIHRLVGLLLLAEVHGSVFRTSQAAHREEVTSPSCSPFNCDLSESLHSLNSQFLVSPQSQTAQKYMSESIL